MADRAVSTALNYVLSLAIVAVLVGGLFVGMGGFVEDQRQQAVRSELSVVGNRLATDVGTAQRLALAADAQTVELAVRLPDRVSGTGYLVDVTRVGSQQYVLVLRAPTVDVSQRVRLRSRVPLRQTTVSGGDLSIRYDAAADRLEVTDD